MGADGCGWVHWGAGGTGDTKTRQAGVIYGLADQDLGPMAGEISPDIMFWEGVQKMAQMGADGYRLMQMGANGRMVNGGSKNKAKGAINEQKQGIF